MKTIEQLEATERQFRDQIIQSDRYDETRVNTLQRLHEEARNEVLRARIGQYALFPIEEMIKE